MIEAQDRAIYFFRLSYPESKLAQYSTELLRITLYTNTLDFCRKYIAWRSN